MQRADVLRLDRAWVDAGGIRSRRVARPFAPLGKLKPCADENRVLTQTLMAVESTQFTSAPFEAQDELKIPTS